MISVSDFVAVRRGKVTTILSREEGYCPICGGSLRVYGTCIRKVQAGEDNRSYRLRVLHCRGCGSYHRELPDCIIPYKRTGIKSYCEIAEADKWEYPCEESTWRRMRMWIVWFIAYAESVVQSKMRSGRSHKPSEGEIQLVPLVKYLVRVVVNNGKWIHNRSAMTSL